MKSTKTMVAILAITTLGLAGMTAAAAPDTENGSRQAGSRGTDEARQRRTERSQSADGRGEATRQQRRDSDTNEGRRASRQDRGLEDTAGPAGRRNQERSDARTVADRRSAEGRRAHEGANRHAPVRNGWRNDHTGRREFTHARGDRREGARAERRFGDHGRAGHGSFDKRVDRRLSNQRARIHDARKSGELTRREMKSLRRDQHKIARMDRRFGSDGRYTHQERRKLNKALDRASRKVTRATRNDRVAHVGRSYRGSR